MIVTLPVKECRGATVVVPQQRSIDTRGSQSVRRSLDLGSSAAPLLTAARRQCFIRHHASTTVRRRSSSPPAPACSDCISLFPVQQLRNYCRCLVLDAAAVGGA